MIIDSHQHFWKYNPVRDCWITNEILQKDFLPSDLEPILKSHHIDGCIAVQADQSETETNFLLDCAKHNNFIKAVVGWIDLRAENIEERLIQYSNEKLLKGVRHIVQAETDPNFMLGKAFMNGISKLSQYYLTYDILIHNQQLTAAIELVNAFPNQIFILDHIAKPAISKGLDATWVKQIETLGSYKNVYCKLSGMTTETENFKWQAHEFLPFINTVVNAFSVDRVMYGSDWPVCLLAGTYNHTFALVKDYIKDFSATNQAKVLGLNAIKAYQI